MVSEQLSDMAVEYSTCQFGKKLQADSSIALCRLECQLAQQSSLTPSNFKESLELNTSYCVSLLYRNFFI